MLPLPPVPCHWGSLLTLTAIFSPPFPFPPFFSSQVLAFREEEDLLRAWRDLVIQTDPDIIIGYNIINFDLPYLLNRAAALKVRDFPVWGRVRNSQLRMRDATFSSKAYGTRESKEITIEGRVQVREGGRQKTWPGCSGAGVMRREAAEAMGAAASSGGVAAARLCAVRRFSAIGPLAHWLTPSL